MLLCITMTQCQVLNCRFNHTHITSGHMCGTCKKYGHGQMECGDISKMSNLNQYKSDELMEDNWCKNIGCEHQRTHTTDAHHCSKCFKRHGETTCIIQTLDTHRSMYSGNKQLNEFDSLKFMNTHRTENVYCIVMLGMGCTLYIRIKSELISSIFMHSDMWGQYGPTCNDRPIFEAFIEGAHIVQLDPFMTPVCQQ